MKKFIALMAMATVCSASAMAQNVKNATLKHGSEYSYFFGDYALTDAMKAAVDGDVITLSAGEFRMEDCNKALTVRGVGYKGADNETTRVSGASIRLNSKSKLFTFEGIKLTGNVYPVVNEDDTESGEIRFVKSQVHLSGYYYYYNAKSASAATKIRMYDCRVYQMTIDEPGYWDIALYNCTVPYYITTKASYGPSAIRFDHCTLAQDGYAYYLDYASLVKCLILDTSNPLPETASVDYCVGSENVMKNITGGVGNQIYANEEISNIVTDYTNEWGKNGYYYTGDYVMAAEAAAKYVGSDGKQVGIYGGSYPFNYNLSYPVISTFSVDPLSAKDGKVNYELQTK